MNKVKNIGFILVLVLIFFFGRIFTGDLPESPGLTCPNLPLRFARVSGVDLPESKPSIWSSLRG